MTDAIEVLGDHGGATHLVGWCHYLARRRGQSLVFEYADAWHDRAGSFARDPANLPLEHRRIYSSSNKSTLPGVVRDTAPDHWGQQLIRHAFRKAGEQRALSEIGYLFVHRRSDENRRAPVPPGRRRGFRSPYRQDPACLTSSGCQPALINAADAVQSNTETAEDLKLLLNEGSPLGGARPKSAVIDNAGRLAIAKFPEER